MVFSILLLSIAQQLVTMVSWPVTSCREEGGTYLDVIVAGGTQCEMTQCDHSVPMGAGELTLSLYSGRVE